MSSSVSELGGSLPTSKKASSESTKKHVQREPVVFVLPKSVVFTDKEEEEKTSDVDIILTQSPKVTPVLKEEPILDLLDEHTSEELLCFLTEVRSKKAMLTHVILSHSDTVDIHSTLGDLELDDLRSITRRCTVGNSWKQPSRRLKKTRLEQYLQDQREHTSDVTEEREEKEECDVWRLHCEYRKILAKKHCIGSVMTFPKLASVVIIHESDRSRVLLTRRAAHMRSFPGCWVFPGGGLDSGESLEGCAVREAREETGMQLSQSDLKILCVWDSNFPDSTSSLEISHHHCIVFFTCEVGSIQKTQLKLDPSETDRAAWVTQKDFMDYDSANEWEKKGMQIRLERDEAAECVGGISEDGFDIMIDKRELRGIYPNPIRRGIGRGHLFALKCFVEKYDRTRLT